MRACVMNSVKHTVYEDLCTYKEEGGLEEERRERKKEGVKKGWKREKRKRKKMK